MPAECPKCGARDQARAVSAIVNEQTSETTTVSSGWARTSRGSGPATYTSHHVTRTPLAKALLFQPPQRPGIGWRWFLAFFGVFWAYWIGYIAFVDEKSFPLYAHVTVFVLLGGWIPIMGIGLLVKGYADRRFFRAQEPVWQRAASIWYDKLSYCGRDDIVYLPDGYWARPYLSTDFVYTAADREMAGSTARSSN
jgi:hypothetical protein